jgi:DNA repair protein RadC
MNASNTLFSNDSPALLNDLRPLFGARAQKVLADCGGTATGVVDALRYRRGKTWDKFRAALAVKERALLESASGRAEVSGPSAVKEFLVQRLGNRPFETFAVLFLTTRHTVIAVRELFRGTIDGASVHPREVIREVLELNAAAVVLAHVHPSGVAEPSHADELITRRVCDALALVDVRVLDHIIVAGNHALSFAERGLL